VFFLSNEHFVISEFRVKEIESQYLVYI